MGTVRHSLSWLAVVTALVMISLTVAWIARETREQTPLRPERVLPLPTSTPPLADPSKRESGKEDPTVTPSAIVSISIPAIGVKADASGAIKPAASKRCKGAGITTCMDPPKLDQVAWSAGYGVPASPSDNAVLLYGHSNAYSDSDQTFNNLGALAPGDKVVLTTKTGIFTYQVLSQELIPFEEVPWRKDLYRNTPGKLVMFTCNLNGGGYDASAVVTAMQISAKPLA